MVAAGSGIVGNLAYDVLKNVARRTVTVIRNPEPAIPEHHQLLLLARLAVQLRCNQLGVAEPKLESLRLVHRLERGEIIEFFLRNSELSARVALPRQRTRSQQPDVSVTLFTVNDVRVRRPRW